MIIANPKSAAASEPLLDPFICDPLTGIVKSWFEVPLEPEEPRIWCFIAQGTSTSRYDVGFPDSTGVGCGAGLTREWALNAAVGELIERYAAALQDPNDLIFSSYDNLGQRAVDPERFALFSRSQYEDFARRPGNRFGYRPFSRSAVTGWVPGFSLTAKEEVLVPGPFVYLPYRKPQEELPFVDGNSTGLACGRSRDAATLNALYEAIERDAVSIAWFNKLTQPQIRLDLEDPLGKIHRERFAVPGERYVLLDFTLDIPIPTYAAMLIDERGGTVMASATRLDPYAAAEKALLEAAQGKVAWKRELISGPPERFADDFHDVVDFPHHSKVYMLREMRKHIEFMWSSKQLKSLDQSENRATGDAGRDLQTCVSLMERAGLEVIAVDLTSEDLRSAGYWVIRVIVPGLQSLNGQHDLPQFGGTRLYEVPHRLGLRRHPTQEHELNTVLHPFP